MQIIYSYFIADLKISKKAEHLQNETADSCHMFRDDILYY